MIFHLSWIYWYKNVNPDSSVLCFALRSSQTEWYNIRDSPLEFRVSFGGPTIDLDSSLSSWLVQRSHLLHWRLHCIWTIRLYFSNSDVYSSFMNYYSLSIPLHYITLWSVIDLFIVYFMFCQILINNSVFLIIQVGYVWFYYRFEWSKIAGRYSWYQSFGSRQNLAYMVNLFTESLSLELNLFLSTRFPSNFGITVDR